MKLLRQLEILMEEDWPWREIEAFQAIYAYNWSLTIWTNQVLTF